MIQESKFDGYLRADSHDHIREFIAICDMFKYGETESEAVKLLVFPFSLCDKAKIWFDEFNEESITSWEQMRRAFIRRFFPPSSDNNDDNSRLMEKLKAIDSQITSLKEELQDMRDKYYDLRDGNASKNPMNDNTPMCERHEVNYIQSEGYQNRNSHNLYSHQSCRDPNDYEKTLAELNNDVRKDLEDFKRCMRSMKTGYHKLFKRDDDLEKSITKFLDGQRVTNISIKNNVNDMILNMKQNEKNVQTKVKNIERKLDEWEKSQDVSSEQIDKTEPPPPPQANTEHVNAVFIGSGKSDNPPKFQKDPSPPIIINNKIKKR
ncbi:reverse transcriptase domain-containing protein [Tanacetum coccineum]|uniref:Reverse transcriptase domain-containing protein n=1 Tax=Tanacetum coccineum TaxID=301880 RepID=A0ABQ4WTY0_9ASTR